MTGGPSSRPEWRKAEGSKGGMGCSTWVMLEPSPETVEDLRRRFPKVIQLPEKEIRSRSEVWLAKGLVAKSLGRRVSVEAAVREIRLRGGLKGDVNGYRMDERFMAFRFTETKDRDHVLQRPWVVNGQPLAVECWKPRFTPTRTAIQSAVVWVRLPWLPVEFWGEETIRCIVEPAGELISLDECTINHRRLGFARAAIRISLAQPLRPGVIIGDPEGGRWQRFVYEQLAGICFTCGTFHGDEVACSVVEGSGPAKLQSENFAGDTYEEGDGSVVRQELGPWIAAVRGWLPAEPKEKPQRRADQKTEEPPVNPRRSEVASGKKPLVFGAVPAGSQVVEGWTKPSKVARRRSHQNHKQQRNQGPSYSPQGGGGGGEVPAFSEFSLAELKAATNGFGRENIVSESGEKAPNLVYKGRLQYRRWIAVKKFTKTAWPNPKQFAEEAWGVGKLRHKWLVNLIGYCCDGNERLLVAEYMPNDTLAKQLFHCIVPFAILVLELNLCHYLNFRRPFSCGCEI